MPYVDFNLVFFTIHAPYFSIFASFMHIVFDKGLSRQRKKKLNSSMTLTQSAFTCSKLTIEALEQEQYRHQNNTLASFWCLYCYLWTYFTPCSSASIVNFEHVIAGWTCKSNPGDYKLLFLCHRKIQPNHLCQKKTKKTRKNNCSDGVSHPSPWHMTIANAIW